MLYYLYSRCQAFHTGSSMFLSRLRATRLPSLGEAHRIELEQLTALASLVVSGVFAEQLAVLGRRHFL